MQGSDVGSVGEEKEPGRAGQGWPQVTAASSSFSFHKRKCPGGIPKILNDCNYS